jgi:membrane protease YdiL (CAAX protease family)
MTDVCVNGAAAASPASRSRAVESGLLAVGIVVASATALGSSQFAPLAILLFVVPVVEETCFRAGLQEWLLRHRCSQWHANLVTALAFTGAHCLWRGFEAVSVAVLLPALLLGWTYGRWRSVRLCIAFHILMNTVWVGVGPALLPTLRSL